VSIISFVIGFFLVSFSRFWISKWRSCLKDLTL